MTTIFITLLAVVLLILVIGFFAMRFLRAEREDPFEDVPSDRDRALAGDTDDRDWDHGGRPRSAGHRSDRGGNRGRADGSSPPPASGRAARDHAGGRGNQDARAYAEAREYSDARPARFDEYGQAGRGRSDRGLQDRGFDDGDTAVYGPPVQGPSDRNGSRASGSGPRGAAPRPDSRSHPGRPVPAAPSGRPASADTRNGRARRAADGTDWDSLSDVDYWAELASDKSLTIAQPPGAAQHDVAARPAAGSGSRLGYPGSPLLPGGQPAAAALAQPEDSTALLPRRRHATGSPGDSPALSSPTGRGDRADSARPPSQRRELPGDSYGDPRGVAPSRSGTAAPGADQGLAALARLGTGSSGSGLSSGTGYGNGGSRPAGGTRSGSPNDDPLTSPSFPAIRADDSRSYRVGRPDGGSDPLSSDSYGGSPQPGRPQQTGPQRAISPPAAYSAGARDPLGGYGGRPAGTGRSETGPTYTGPTHTGRTDSGHLGRPADSWAEQYSRSGGGLLDSRVLPGSGAPRHAGGLLDNTGPRSYEPPAPAPTAPPASLSTPAGYPAYAEQPVAPAVPAPPVSSGNPYGGSSASSADRYAAPGSAASHPGSNGGYDSYLTGQDTRQYRQPTGSPQHQALSAPMYAAPVQADPVHQVPASPTLHSPSEAAAAPSRAGYGEAWYGSPGPGGYPGPDSYSGTGGYPSPSYGDPGGGNGPAQAGNGRDQSVGSYQNGGYAQHSGGPAYSPAPYEGQPYGQPAYPPAEPPATQHDQRGYGTPDSGYGADGYGGYPNY